MAFTPSAKNAATIGELTLGKTVKFTEQRINNR
jgi:hypothetical protein